MEEWEEFKKGCRQIGNKNNNGNTVNNGSIAQIKNVIYDIPSTSAYNNFVLEKDKTLGLDRNTDKKLKSGKLHIDARLDLHGFTIDNAYHIVTDFIEKSISNNCKMLLIITGKGLHSNNETIKDSLVKWFREPYFSNRIIKYTDAQTKHGGTGAVYVLLRDFF
jgi:DNA-nicking Smr family endonuclease